MKKKLFYVHTDFANYYFHHNQNNQSNRVILNKMLSDIADVCSDNFIIPTYNFKFSKNSIFNYYKDVSETGIFSEFFRKKYNNNRTFVPIWSDCFYKKKIFVLVKKIYPFGKKSIFEHLYNKNGYVMFFGSNFSPTFLHYIENKHLNKIFYREKKEVEGKIIYKKKIKTIVMKFHVRKKNISLQYDLKKIEKDLKKNNILKYYKTQTGFQYSAFNAKTAMVFISKKINLDNLYLLKKNSAKRICATLQNRES